MKWKSPRFTPWLPFCLLPFCLWALTLVRGGDTGAFEWAPPGDLPAAARVNMYLKAYLENCILAPLDSPTPPPRTGLSVMSIDFAAHIAAAATPEERALYTNAANLCDLVTRVLDEQDVEQGSLAGLSAGFNAVNPLDRPAYGVSGHYSWNLERERARTQRRQEVQARLMTIDRQNSFVAFTLKHWSEQTTRFRQSIQAAAVDVGAAQIRFDRVAASAARPPAAATVQVNVPPGQTPEPSVAASTENTEQTDPVAGDWWTEKGSPLTLQGDHLMKGREGNWVYTCTTNSGRNYELRWAHKGWVDYVVLSGDGKTLYGKSRNKAIAFYRR